MNNLYRGIKREDLTFRIDEGADYYLQMALRRLRMARNLLPAQDREEFAHRLTAYFYAELHPNGRAVKGACPIAAIRPLARRKLQVNKRKSSTLM